ncbi:MAG: bifunctional phosphoribosylaminoimidazolecarboxamide formyltransferase/IMP cyclohydrolase [Phycisphaeraceae bacterium]|nr:bifunctional phosphoribosylaminoimidazolecarboxamide formyltransferase/IMP cyclohydrolase [Phycisphaeraceae bacterium]
MADLVPIRRALLSVSDKTGLLEFARGLHALGVTLISTGGTARALAEAGLPVTPVERVTGFPEMMDGRLKTLHPRVHGGILAVRDEPAHAAAMAEHGIEPIDLVCVNLYPFGAIVARPGVTLHDAIENIDIGGPAMVRSAAKNHAFVAVVTSPDQYARVLDDLRDSAGSTTLRLRRDLAAAAFAHTAEYDAAIAAHLSRVFADRPDGEAPFPTRLTLRYERAQALRYGENPHQRAAVYRDPAWRGPSVVGARQLHGKELSYNNINDAAAALELALSLSSVAGGSPAAAVIKHANPCGAATGGSVPAAVDRAIAGDPLAAFGGIIASSAPIDEAAAARLTRKDVFLEVLLAPRFEPAALELLRARSANIRLLEFGAAPSEAGGHQVAYRSFPGGLLAQEADRLPPDPARWEHKAGPAPDASQVAAAAALEVMVRSMSSNAIAIGGADPASPGSVRLFGGGVGQVDRVTACRLAVEKARAGAADELKGAVAVSDAFFPFPDGPRILIDAGVGVIVHPGGSKRDQETFDLCTAHGVTCLVTGVRRFRH